MATKAPAGLKAVIFDLDGVVFDSLHQNIVLYNHMLAALGLPPRAEEAVEVIHRCSMDESLRHLVGDGEMFARAMDYWRGLDPTPFIKELRLFPGAVETLARLGGRYTLGVATNRARTTRQALAHFDLLRHFASVVTPIEAGKSKPDPAMMHFVLAELGLGPEQAVYVGDSGIDQEMADAAGVRLIAFQADGLRAWAHVEALAEIPPLLGLD